MYAYADASYPGAPQKAASGALAVAVHVLLAVLFIFSVHWQHEQEAVVNVVDLWSALPSSNTIPPPPPPPEPVPEIKPVPVPKVEEVPPPVLPKPDIALKEEKLKKEKLLEEKLKKEDDKKRKQETEQARINQEKQDDAKLAAQRSAASEQAKVVAEYTERIRRRVRQFLIIPPSVDPAAEALFNITVLPGGEVISPTLRRSSGNTLYDEAVERAIIKAQPLPLPPDPTTAAQFRNLDLKFRPQE